MSNTVRICHKKGRIVREHEQSYEVEIELGGVHQHISVTKEYVENQ